MRKTLVILSLALCASAGCSARASLVRSDAHGGTVALEGPFMPAMSEARLLMVDHCGGRIEVEERGDRAEFRCTDSTAKQHIARPDLPAGL